MDINLNGKNVVVTGAARGIGREICAGFALAGANVIAVDMRDMAETQAFVRAKRPQAKLDQHIIDLANPSSVEQGCRDILAKYPAIDVLVNNGAI